MRIKSAGRQHGDCLADADRDEFKVVYDRKLEQIIRCLEKKTRVKNKLILIRIREFRVIVCPLDDDFQLPRHLPHKFHMGICGQTKTCY